jgi:hypothetical protein
MSSMATQALPTPASHREDSLLHSACVRRQFDRARGTAPSCLGLHAGTAVRGHHFSGARSGFGAARSGPMPSPIRHVACGPTIFYNKGEANHE